MELGYGHPMGPLKVSDLVGLDVRLAIVEYRHRTLGGAHYAPPTISSGPKDSETMSRVESPRAYISTASVCPTSEWPGRKS